MQFLTAPEAISPALNRTASLLFRPFRWGTFLKLCAVAVLTEGASGNFPREQSRPPWANYRLSPRDELPAVRTYPPV